MKPAEGAKTEDAQSTYSIMFFFFILKSNTRVHTVYCPCEGGIHGACKHFTAARFDLQSMVSIKVTNSTCTSEKGLWKYVEIETVTMPFD